MMKSKKIASPRVKSINQPPEKLYLREHIKELLRRFYFWLGVFILGTLVGFIFYNPVLNWLVLPLGKPLFYTSPTGGFEVVFGVAALFGFILSLPVLLYEIVRFVKPASPKFKGVKIFRYVLGSFALAMCGIATAYYLVFPASLQFLNRFGSGQLQALISTKEYFNFISRYLIGFAILFQLPLIIYLINFFVEVTPKFLLSKFRYVFTISFVIAAILTPTPDFINQSIMAAPLIGLYLISILILWLNNVMFK